MKYFVREQEGRTKMQAFANVALELAIRCSDTPKVHLLAPVYSPTARACVWPVYENENLSAISRARAKFGTLK
jgi:hypothetical protein